ncbi:F-box/LRR-repeat protein At3g58900-like isoform X3 [Silene latifolia]|uniref:F-box/LRR-repeat protein At3g58900-like isoform X3 n=1 Tax=Silene latifolia TaxID=37657 RepID=UPI003D76B64B
MIRSTKRRKVSEIRDEGSLDRISSLPDELLGHILSFLPTLSALQTSLLSTRWRYLFTLTTSLSFDDQEYYELSSHGNKTLNTGFERFVSGVLVLHRVTPIQKFSLKLKRDREYASSHLLLWISASILKGVRHLDLYIFYQQISLPNCILSSQTLVSLEIHSVRHKVDLKVPSLVSLPSLRFLKLIQVTFLDAESVKRFCVGCSRLKELVLIDCGLGRDHVGISTLALEELTVYFCRGHVEFDAPNLASLSYLCSWSDVDVDMTLLLKKSCSPSRVEIGFHSYEFHGPLAEYVLDLIRGAQNARELILTFNALKGIADTCRTEHKHEWRPSMELAPFSSNVKTIEVHRFEGGKMELLLLNYLLENAGVLKRLILYKCGTMTMEEELEVSKELLMLPKTSTYCTIELK